METTTILSEVQTKNAVIWYDKHKDHVDGLVKRAKYSYPPSEPEDKTDPKLWKGEHWSWFINTLS